MSRTARDWYDGAFDVLTTQLPQCEGIEEDVNQVLKILRPRGGEQILDLGCGDGRHAAHLAERGFRVVGVDISEELIDLAIIGTSEKLHTAFLNADLRLMGFEEEFDFVIGFDSPIGYFENEPENYRGFEAVARSLRSGGRCLIEIPNFAYAVAHLPERTWEIGSDFAELIYREWNAGDRYMEGEIYPIELIGSYEKPMPISFRQRVYDLNELRDIFRSVGMTFKGAFGADGDPQHPSPDQYGIYILAEKD